MSSDKPGQETAAPIAGEHVAAFYDARVENEEDLNAKSVPDRGPAYHHSGIVRWDEEPPAEDDEALAWLYRTEEALTDLVWSLALGLAPREPRRVLDAGCGEGASVARFLELSGTRGIEATGITLSPKQAEIAQRFLPQCRWLVGNMLECDDIPAGAFDLVVAIESTEYLGSERLPEFMRRAARWLDEGGLLLVVAGSWIEKPSNADDYAKLAGFDDHYLTRLSSTKHYREAAAASGLSAVGELDLSPATRRYWEVRAARPVLRNSPDGLVERIIAASLALRKGEFRAYAWIRPRADGGSV